MGNKQVIENEMRMNVNPNDNEDNKKCEFCNQTFQSNSLYQTHLTKCQGKRVKKDQLKSLENFFTLLPSIESLAQKAVNAQAKNKEEEPRYNVLFDVPSKADVLKLNFEEKVKIFKTSIQSLKIDWREGCDTLELNRDDLINLSITQFKKINPYKELKINFAGEVNLDAGGLIREWLTVLFKEIQSKEKNLFERADTNEFSLKISSTIDKSNKDNLELFFFIGQLLAKALFENLTVNTCFNKYIYKIILNEKISFDDLIFIDKSLYHSFEEIKKIPNIKDLEIFFATQTQDPETKKIITKDLIVNGNNIKVNNDNLQFYIQKRIESIMTSDITYIYKIKKGLISLIPIELIQLFSSSELELLLNGTPFIDIEDWKMNSSYSGYDHDDQIISNFWSLINVMTQDELGKLLQYCTGSSRVPIGGFKSLESNRGNVASFCITKSPYNEKEKQYIRAHTCFNRLDIPNFPTREMLKEAIDFIIQNEILGFGID